MKNFWKWILGIVVVLVVFFCLSIGARLLMVNFLPAASTSLPFLGGRGMYHFTGMMPMGFSMFRLGGLLPLLLLGLLVYGAYRLGTRQHQPAAPQAAACPKCGQPVQSTWNHCPACGEKI